MNGDFLNSFSNNGEIS